MSGFPLASRVHRVSGRACPALSARLALHQFLRPAHPATGMPALPGEPESIRLAHGQNAWRWGGSGPIVLLQHGWNGHAGQFACLLAPLLAAGCQVIALAGPGHAGSPAREDYVLGFATFLLHAVRELGGVEAVLGHSLGGAAALIAMRHGLEARRIATLAAPSSLCAAVSRFAAGQGLSWPAQHRLRAALRQRIGVPLDWIDTASLVRGLGFDALIAHDLDDRHVPHRDAVRIAEALPRARLVSTRGLRHVGGLGDPNLVGQFAAFLTGADRTRGRIAEECLLREARAS